MFLVLFSHDLRDNPTQTLAWLRRLKDVSQVKAPLAEQKFLLQLLHSNAKRLPSSYKPTRGLYEAHFTASFLLLVGPLLPTAITSENSNECAVCGFHQRAQWLSYCALL